MAKVAPPMRTFQVRGPFGLQMTFRTKVPGTLWFRYPRVQRTEPLAEDSSATEATVKDYVKTFDQIYIDIPMGATQEQRNPDTELAVPCRAPSPTPTEVEQTQEEIVQDIQQKGIKVRDFAYEKLPPDLKPVPEFFDPDRALGEHDHKLSIHPRRFPISGKVLRRLLDAGWVTMQEARAKWHQMDWDALAAFDKKPQYPYKRRLSNFPTPEERGNIRKARAAFMNALEKALIQEQGFQILRFFRSQPELETQSGSEGLPLSSPSRGEKRVLSKGGEHAGGDDQSASPPDAKRRKVGGKQRASESNLSPSLRPPPKQFPAPVVAYAVEVQSMISAAADGSGSSGLAGTNPTISQNATSLTTTTTTTTIPPGNPSNTVHRPRGLKRQSTFYNL